jgi:hypothetical protein
VSVTHWESWRANSATRAEMDMGTLESAMDGIDASKKRQPNPEPHYAPVPRGYRRLPGGNVVLLSAVTSVVTKQEARAEYVAGIRSIVDVLKTYTEVHVSGMVVCDDAPQADVERALWGKR